MKLGQGNKIMRGAGPGTAPDNQRSTSTDIFGDIYPNQGAAAALVLLRCNTDTIELHLKVILEKITPVTCGPAIRSGRPEYHAQVGPASQRHDRAAASQIPRKLQGNIWPFMRDNWLSGRVSVSYDNIVDHRCCSWNRLAEQP